jgi:alkylated DNA repair dioxygenase AlkB
MFKQMWWDYSGIPGLFYGTEGSWDIESGAGDLLSLIDQRPWSNELKRRVQHFGYKYDYRDKRISANSYVGELPEEYLSIGQRFVDVGLFKKQPDQVIVNEYLPGQGIAPHVDCVPCFGPEIATITLGAAYPLLFQHRKTLQHITITPEASSLLILYKEARYDWAHSIERRKEDNGISRGRRVSITFRTVLL